MNHAETAAVDLTRPEHANGNHDGIRFAIDPDKRAIVEIEGLGKAAD